VLKVHWQLAIYAILLMTAFNFFSHSTQDLYPTFLEVEHGFSPGTVGTIAVIYNIGAILGGLTFGSLSERIGRRRAIVAAALLSLPIVPLWAFSGSPVLLAIGAFLMQFMVQGAWGVIPAHLNELSPADARGTFPGVVYQLGNLFAAVNMTLQAGIAAHFHNEFSVGLASVATCVAIIVALLTGFGVEAKGVRLAAGRSEVQYQPAKKYHSTKGPPKRTRTAGTARSITMSGSDLLVLALENEGVKGDLRRPWRRKSQHRATAETKVGLFNPRRRQAGAARWRTGRPACRGRRGPWRSDAGDAGRARRSPSPAAGSPSPAAPALWTRADRKR
jgi:MFS family permease